VSGVAPAPAGSVRLTFTAATDRAKLPALVAATQARLDAFELPGAIVRARDDGALVVTLDAATPDLAEVKDLLARPYEIQLVAVVNDAPYMHDAARRVSRGDGLDVLPDMWTARNDGREMEDVYLRGPKERLRALLDPLPPEPGHAVWFEKWSRDPGLWRTYYVDLTSMVRLDWATDVRVEPGHAGSFLVHYALSSAKGEEIAALTARQMGKKIAVAVDGEIGAAPVVEGVIHGRGAITTTTRAAARQLAAALRAGPLPARLTLVSEERAGP
jgi:preprotein translocase subunit SecD